MILRVDSLEQHLLASDPLVVVGRARLLTHGQDFEVGDVPCLPVEVLPIPCTHVVSDIGVRQISIFHRRIERLLGSSEGEVRAHREARPARSEKATIPTMEERMVLPYRPPPDAVAKKRIVGGDPTVAERRPVLGVQYGSRASCSSNPRQRASERLRLAPDAARA